MENETKCAEVLKRTTPDGRKPGHWLQLKVVNSLDMFNEVWPQLYAEMGLYKAVGFDVECVNFKNAATFYHGSQLHNNNYNNDNDDDDTTDNLRGNLRMPVKPANEKRSRKENSVLIQLATWSGFVLLIRLCYLDVIPHALRSFLADTSILKLGKEVSLTQNSLV